MQEHHSKNTIALLITLVMAVITMFFVVTVLTNGSSAALTDVVVDPTGLTSTSTASESAKISKFSLYSKTHLYKSNQSDLGGAYEFLKKNVRMQNGGGKPVMSASIAAQLKLERTADDDADSFLKKNAKPTNRKHYIFSQQINNVPVYGSRVSVHIENGSGVYAMLGSVTSQNGVQPENLSTTDIVKTVEAELSRLGNKNIDVVVKEKIVYNAKLVGEGEDENNYPAYIIFAVSHGDVVSFAHQYIVDLAAGKIRSDRNMVEFALSRKIADCMGTSTQCPFVRNEGDAPSSVADANKAYDAFGTIYNFYFSNFNRDSYDGNGSILKALVNMPPTIAGVQFCPNAAWIFGLSQMQICPGWVAVDVVGHEVTHGVTFALSKLSNINQSGAVNEAVSDIFGSNMDNNWTFGEDTPAGSFRFLDDPTKNIGFDQNLNKQPFPMPDRLFSPNYYCQSSDSGGVHENMTVLTKAYYLMAVGGQFNGCNLTGIGRIPALTVWYQALSRYFTTTTNFHDVYTSLTQACADIYGSASSQCVAVNRALQATEVDQEVAGDQQGAKCTAVTPHTPACVQDVTITPTPSTGVSPTVTSTTCASGDADCNGKADLIDFEIWRKQFIGTDSGKSADFNHDTRVDLVDFELWRSAFMRG
jgi:Zn-dependent metalloprotease